VPASKVDPIYFDGAYYLGPDKAGSGPYTCWRKHEEHRALGAGPLGGAGKMYLVLIRAIHGGLIMQMLHYADEIRPFSEVPWATRRSRSGS
jgi:DNA end-binding protein Ku